MMISLSSWEINIILRALGDRPYNEVAFIIQDIKEQVNESNHEAQQWASFTLKEG